MFYPLHIFDHSALVSRRSTTAADIQVLQTAVIARVNGRQKVTSPLRVIGTVLAQVVLERLKPQLLKPRSFVYFHTNAHAHAQVRADSGDRLPHEIEGAMPAS